MNEAKSEDILKSFSLDVQAVSPSIELVKEMVERIEKECAWLFFHIPNRQWRMLRCQPEETDVNPCFSEVFRGLRVNIGYKHF